MGEGAASGRAGPQLRRGVGRHPRLARQPGALPLLRRPGAPRGGGRLRRHVVARHLHVRRLRSRRGRRVRSGPRHRGPPPGRHGRRHRRRRRAGWRTTAPTGWCRATGTGAGSPCSRSRGSTPRSRCPGPSWRAGSRRPCTSAPRPTRASRWCGPRCTGTCAGWPTSAPPPRAAALDACRSTSTTWTAPSRRWPGRAHNGIFGGVMLPAMSVTSRLPGYADDYYEPFWSACEDTRHGRQPAHRRVGLGHRHQVPLRRGARRHARPLRGVRLHPPAAVVHDLRRRVRPPPRPQGRRHRERRAVAALAHPGHGVVLRHPRRRARPLAISRCGPGTTSRSTSGWAARS